MMRSGGPPGGEGTTARIGRLGKLPGPESAALAAAGSVQVPSAKQMLKILIEISQWQRHYCDMRRRTLAARLAARQRGGSPDGHSHLPMVPPRIGRDEHGLLASL